MNTTTPRMRPVRSSVLRSFGYAPCAPKCRASAKEIGADGFLFVRLRSGGTYAYLAPAWLVGLLSREGTSKGRIWNRHVKGRPGVRVA